MTRVDNTPREPAIRRLECQAKAPEAAKTGRWGVVPVCNLTVCNGRLCRPEAAKTGRWGEGQKTIQDVL